MPTTIRRSLKSWMLVYVGFVLALTAANIDVRPNSGMELVSPGSLPGSDLVEQTFFRPIVAELPRNDI
jgi:hypothetical protein